MTASLSSAGKSLVELFLFLLVKFFPSHLLVFVFHKRFGYPLVDGEHLEEIQLLNAFERIVVGFKLDEAEGLDEKAVTTFEEDEVEGVYIMKLFEISYQQSTHNY